MKQGVVHNKLNVPTKLNKIKGVHSMSLLGKWSVKRNPVDDSTEITGIFSRVTDMMDSVWTARMTREVIEQTSRRYVKENYAELKKAITAKDVKNAIVEATAQEFINKAFKD